MTDIKLPPYPEGLCLREDIEDYAREAVRLNAQAVPQGWPRAAKDQRDQGWTLEYRFLERVTDLAAPRTEYSTSMEATEQVLIAALEVLAAAPAAPQSAAQQGELQATISRFERQAHRMGELWERCQGKGWPEKESAEFHRLRDELVPASRAAIIAQAQEAAPAAQGEPSDPLQGAANRLLEAINGCNISALQSYLKIGPNRAERLMRAARTAQQKGAKND